MSMVFPSDQESGIVRYLTRLGPTLFRARYRSLVGDSNAANKVPLTIMGASGQTANLLEIYDSSKNGLYAVDKAGNIIRSGVTSILNVKAQVALTAAQIITLHSVPVSLVAAPGAGVALILESMYFQFKYGTVQFTGGGAVNPVYHGASTNLLSGQIAQATVQAAANATISLGARANALAVTTNVGIDLLAAGADFAAGDSTAICFFEYDVLTLG